MKRREFLAVLGGTAITWPLAAQAQRATAPVIGFLSLRTPEFDAALLTAMRGGLREMGYVEGQNLAIETRFAAGQFDRLAGLAEDLVRQRVNLIVTSGGTAVARAAKAVTTSIPIVFAIGDDPVEFGLVASLNRPGGNITGATNFYGTLAEKQLGLLRELIPGADTIGLLVNPNEPAYSSQVRDAQTGAARLARSSWF